MDVSNIERRHRAAYASVNLTLVVSLPASLRDGNYEEGPILKVKIKAHWLPSFPENGKLPDEHYLLSLQHFISVSTNRFGKLQHVSISLAVILALVSVGSILRFKLLRLTRLST